MSERALVAFQTKSNSGLALSKPNYAFILQPQSDSLPYIDTEYNDAAKNQVLKLIQAEMKSMSISTPPPQHSLEFYANQHTPHPAFEASSFWKLSLSTIHENRDSGVDLSRYQQPAYAAIALEYERRRLNHLELMLDVHGEPYYKEHVSELEKLAKFAEQQEARTRKRINDLNRKRKCQQEQILDHLKRAKHNWREQCLKNGILKAEIQKLEG